MTANRKMHSGGADLRDFCLWAKAEGWQYSVTGSGHFRWAHPEVPHPVFTPGTPRVKGFRGKEKAKLRTALRRARENASA